MNLYPRFSHKAVYFIACALFVVLSFFVVQHTALASTFASVKISVLVSGGSATPSDFTVQLKQVSIRGTNTIQATGNFIIFSSLALGTYQLSEVNMPANYHVVWSGDCTSDGVLTVTSSAALTCTANNKFGTIGAIKVTNIISGGTALSNQFAFNVIQGTTTVASSTGSPILFSTLLTGAYTVTQVNSPSNYTPVWSGACDSEGHVTVTTNGTALCTVTNTYKAPTSTSTIPATPVDTRARPALPTRVR